jgi:sulfite exporter TauE/SafE
LPNLLLMGAAAGWLGTHIKKPALRYVAGGLIVAYGLYMLASLYL